MEIWTFLHVATMFLAVALAVTTDLSLDRISDTRDPQTIRLAVARLKPLARLPGPLFLLGIAFGIVAALAHQIDLLRPWLVGAYALFGIGFVGHLVLRRPRLFRLERAAAASPAAPSAELSALIDDRVARWATYAMIVLIVAIVFLMVVKPFD